MIWPDGSRAVSDVSFVVEPGQVVALVGPSGSGKSTLAALLARQADSQHGAILVDNLDLRSWQLKSLRRAIGLVPQETRLFHDTIAANLRLARPHASDQELIEVLYAVELKGFLDKLSDGLETVVGEQGLRISGGERQRVALARDLLKAPQIHILDEATSALDSRTERRVLESFYAQAAGCTMILIAHRLTSVAGADQIFVLGDGRLVESGRHDQLMDADGLYRTLYDEADQDLSPTAPDLEQGEVTRRSSDCCRKCPERSRLVQLAGKNRLLQV
jgi:ATP-binding cassette subfamily B protein